MVDEQASGPEPDLPEIPLEKPRRSPYRRLVLLALFLLTLPFEWGERSSCQGSPRTFTGIDVLTEHPQNGISIAVLFLTPVLLGLLQHRIRNTVVRLLMEFVSMLFASLGTLFCFVNAVFSGGFGSSGRFYPAPWLATLAPLFMVINACQGAVGRISDIVQERKRRQQVATNDEPAKLSPEP
ncbi:hypothetical protein [Polyangium sp. y55x31]|uniref:hypothetical protein n=1 Tax=Polyangium sp. y55x31 TaxID=3042688 RepID=UPI00248237B8|nr:hypothetical protein [Polyangium sp. y55x31]MDI1479414.1 hypothetical protein [Polyangium sp. y55x31]